MLVFNPAFLQCMDFYMIELYGALSRPTDCQDALRHQRTASLRVKPRKKKRATCFQIFITEGIECRELDTQMMEKEQQESITTLRLKRQWAGTRSPTKVRTLGAVSHRNWSQGRNLAPGREASRGSTGQ